MELSRKKQIKRRQLPGFTNGLDYAPQYDQIRDRFNQQSAVNKYTVPIDENAKNIGPWFALGAWVGGGVAKGIGAIEQSDQLISNAGTTNGNVGGIGYTQYNNINQNQIMGDCDKNTALSFLTNPFEGITRLFGRNKQKEQARNAAILTQNLNTANRTGAQTQALQQDYNLRYGNPSNQVLYAAKGKDEGVYTSNGLSSMQPNSLTMKGESIVNNLDPTNPEEATGTVVTEGKGGVDDVPTNVQDSDIILGGDIDWRTGSTFKQQALPYTMALEHINNKYENNGDGLSSLSKQTQKLQQEQVNRLKQPIVEKLKDLADQQKYQHNVTGYNQQFMAARGKDRTIPPLFPSAAMQELLDYYVTKYDKFVADYDDSYNYRNAYRDDYKMFTAPNAVKEYGQEAVDEAKNFANEEDYVNYFMKQHSDKKKKKSDNLKKVLDNNAWGKFLKQNKYANGKDYHTIPNVLGALASIGQSIEAAKQRVKTSDSYVPNTYGSRALNTLAGLRINPYPIMRQVRDAQSQADYALNNSGGLSGSQKYLGRLANANNVYTNYAKLLSDIVTQNNQYTSQYATTAANLGLQDATRRQSANQWDLDYYSKAHTARLGGVQMGIRNLMDYINHWSSDASKLNQFNKMYNLYAVDTYSRANRPV